MKKILIVEDSESQRSYLMILLSQQEHWVKSADSVTTGYHIIVSGTCPDILITDFFLPDGNGLDLIELVRKLKNGDRVYCILMTAATPEYVEQYREKINALRVQVLYKPFEPTNMIEAVRAAAMNQDQ